MWKAKKKLLNKKKFKSAEGARECVNVCEQPAKPWWKNGNVTSLRLRRNFPCVMLFNRENSVENKYIKNIIKKYIKKYIFSPSLCLLCFKGREMVKFRYSLTQFVFVLMMMMMVENNYFPSNQWAQQKIAW
jgi:hypothetical protein